MKQEKPQVAEFTLQDIVPIAATIVVAGIFVGYGLKIEGDTKTSFITNTAGCNSTHTQNCGYDFNSTNDAQVGVSKLSGQFPTLGLIAGAVIIIGMLGYLVYRQRT